MVAGVKSDKMLALDEALSRLAAVDERQARWRELRFFGGMTEEEIAGELESRRARSCATGDWRGLGYMLKSANEK